MEFNALTCIDSVTNLVELIHIDNKMSRHVAQQFENVWLSRYPRPNRCIHDRSGEFIGEEFQEKLQQHAIDDVPITVKNPQANSICERIHQTVANVLRTSCELTTPQNETHSRQMVDDALATAMYATRCAVARTLETLPGALVFRRDMFLDVLLLADLVQLQERRQQVVNKNLQ